MAYHVLHLAKAYNIPPSFVVNSAFHTYSRRMHVVKP